MGVTRVIVHIDRLVLRGVGAADRIAVADGLQRELGVQLAQPGVARRLVSRSDVPHLNVGRISVGAAATPASFGMQVAHRIARKVKA